MDRKELETLIRTLVEQYLARGPLHADPVPRGQPCLKVVTEVEVREAGLEGIVPAAADAIVTAAADDLARAWGVRIQRGGPALKRPRCVDVGADHAGYETKEDTKQFLDLCRTEDLRQLVQCGAERFGVESRAASVSGDLAQYIDHTLLKPDASEAQIRQLCKEAAQYRFATVCVNPTWVRLCARVLKGTGVGICTVAGFPLGATPGDVKAYEARRAVFDGANEVDMVINVGLLKSGRDDLVLDDICHVARTVHDGCARVKVIIEAALLTNEEKVRACTLAKQAGADYVKTSTGFGPGGATAEDVALMRRVVGTEIGVKAAGGIRDLAAAQKMIAAGATRVGASAGVKIVQEALKSGGK